ncbi:MAG: homoserine dehydrogenase [Actinobacteria bacterium]|nr:homoserine dehydrogenase [Actinomycetota bacterium]
MAVENSRPVGVALLGAGTVGSSLIALLAEPEAAASLESRTGLSFEIIGAVVRDLSRSRNDGAWFDPAKLTTDAASLIADERVEVVIELMGGIEPAAALVRQAIAAGKPVVTANKTLLADQGRELSALAEMAGVDLNFEAAVAGAVPVVRTLRESLAGERITRVMGIVNGTTNFILSTMTELGAPYAETLGEAQALGFAEADPSADVDGHDAAQKAAVLAYLAFGADLKAEQVRTFGISAVSAEDIAAAKRLGYVIKLLCVVELANSSAVAAKVAPASAVLGDLVDVALRHRSSTSNPAPKIREGLSLQPFEQSESAFYLSIAVADRPGVLAQVATAFGDHGVSILSMEQVGLAEAARLVFVTHETSEGQMAETLKSLEALDAVEAIGSILRVVPRIAGDN